MPEVIDAWRTAGASQARTPWLSDSTRSPPPACSTSPTAPSPRDTSPPWCGNPPQSRSFFGVLDLDDADVDDLVTEGVDAFLRIYQPR